MRRRLPSLLLVIASCAPAATPPSPPSGPSAPPAASASAPAAPRFDPARPDAIVLEQLAQIPDPGPVESALNESSRRDLARALGYFSESEKENLRDNPNIGDELKPLLWVAMHPDDKPSMEALYRKGNTWKALRILRPREAPAEDLIAGTRRLVTWAARAHAKHASLPGRAPVSAIEADHFVDIARVLSLPALESAASALAVRLEPTSGRLFTAAYSAARNLELELANRHLTALRGLPPTNIPPWSIPSLEHDIAQATELQRLGGGQASKENAPEAAALAARAGRYDLVDQILKQHKMDAESDLRVATASASAQIDGVYCLGLEWAREPQEVCAAAWGQNPDRTAISEQLERALKSGKGKTPAALEAYLGITQILPMTYLFLGGQVSSREQLLTLLTQYRDSTNKTLAVDGVPAFQRSAIALFSETLYQAAVAALRSASPNWRIDDATANKLIEQAQSALEQHPKEFLAQQAALSVAMLLFRSRDTGPLLQKIQDAPRLIPTRSRAAAYLGLLRSNKSLLEEGLRGLDATPPWLSPPQAARSQLLALEIHAAQTPSAASQEAMLKEVSAPFPEKSEAIDQLQRLTERVGVLARLGRRDEIEQVINETIKKIQVDMGDSSTVDLLGVLQTIAESQLATSPDPAIQRRGMARLREHLMAPEPGISEVVQFYRSRVLKELLEQGRTHCVTSEASCRGERNALRAQNEKELKRLKGEVMPELQKLVEQGVVLAGSNAKMQFSYSARSGLAFHVDYTPRLLQALPPGQVRPAKKRP